VIVQNGMHLTVPNDQVNADAHAEVYWRLVHDVGERDWDVQFTADGKFVS
jgi:hypothetical protein